MKNLINIQINIAYSLEVYSYSKIPVTIIKNNDSNIESFDLQEALNYLIDKQKLNLNNKALSIYDEDLLLYICLGKFPLMNHVIIPYSDMIKLKIRSLQSKYHLLKMEFYDEKQYYVDEEKENIHINENSKRSKERKIGYVIEKVFLWRKLYNGFYDEEGNLVKFTLEEAADKVGISKKSLDDYLIQLRLGKIYDFNFNEHKNEKVGALRAFVKKQKSMKENKDLEVLDNELNQ